jgi:ABC-type arginine/histidine transport system permease subunit
MWEAVTSFIRKYILNNFFSFLFTLSAGICIILAIVTAIDGNILANTSTMPSWVIFLIAGVFYLLMAMVIGVIRKRIRERKTGHSSDIKPEE